MAGSADAAPHVIVADKSNAAAEDELRAKLRAEVEAQVRQELEAQWIKELADREAKIRATVEAELRAMYGKEAVRAFFARLVSFDRCLTWLVAALAYNHRTFIANCRRGNGPTDRHDKDYRDWPLLVVFNSVI